MINIKDIIANFPSRDVCNTYVEPFGGTFSVGLSVEEPFISEIYNDNDKYIYDFFNVLNTPSLFDEFKKKCENPELTNVSDVVNKSYEFFKSNKAGAETSLKNITPQKRSSNAIEMLGGVDGLLQLCTRLTRVIVTNRPPASLIEKYCDEKSFTFCNTLNVKDDDIANIIKVIITQGNMMLILGDKRDAYSQLENNGFRKIKIGDFFLWRNY